MKAIAVTDDKRLGALPDVPAVAEATGMKVFDVVAWTGLFAPARTPAAVVDRLNRELNDVLASEEMRTKLGEQGAVPGSGTGPAFGAFIEREQGRYAHIVKAANIRE
jgi:tripartite-type tricarboxylate transporter receptor subunit TctC